LIHDASGLRYFASYAQYYDNKSISVYLSAARVIEVDSVEGVPSNVPVGR